MSKVKVHTIDQPDSDITTFILSCNRLDVLSKTINSFLATKFYKTKMVIVDDSAEEGVFETLVERYGSFCDVIAFPKNRSQWWAMDFMVSYCDTEYIFYLEDDWEFVKSNYLQKSKQILEKYRDIGTVDISMRTFEWQGIDSYDKTLIDDMFYYKKLWRISDYHLHWYGWVGSPNLKRRDDLIMLGRVEKWHNEWNIDRKFLGMGFKAVFLKDKYVEHLGDNCSRMEGKRPDDSKVPDDYYPKELDANRVYPKFDYYQWDTHLRSPNDICIVTALINIDRSDRDFEEHYIKGLSNLLETRHPIVVFAESKYHDKIRSIRKGRLIRLIDTSVNDIENIENFSEIQNIMQSEKWITQDDWMKDSVIGSKHYIPLTLMKQMFLQKAIAAYSHSNYYYWVDAGMYNSYNVPNDFNQYYFTKIPKDKFFITSFPYWSNKEMHGFSMDGMEKICGDRPRYVCRATLFGGTKEQITNMTPLFYSTLNRCIEAGYIGAEEAIYTILSVIYKDLFEIYKMPSGDINNYLQKIK